MIRNALSDIINVNIEISTPATGDESFDSILCIVEEPTGTGTLKAGTSVIAIAEPDELKEYGFVTNSQAYIMANVAFSQTPKPDTLYFIVRQPQLDDGGDPKEDAEGNVLYEDISETLSRANESGGWYGIGLSKTFYVEKDLDDTKEWTEANQKLFGFTFTGNTLPITATNYFRTFAVYGGGVPDVETTPDENYYINIAMMAKCFGYDPGSETWALKNLSVISPCKLSSDMKKYCDDNFITYFTTYAKKNVTSAMGGKVIGNEWIDTIRFRDWMQNDMQERVFNFLALNQKVPFTDNGITGIEGKMEETLLRGQEVGGIAPTEYDDDDNEYPGYTIKTPKSLDLTDAEKATRQLTGCTFTAKLAGAIQAVKINGNLKY